MSKQPKNRRPKAERQYRRDRRLRIRSIRRNPPDLKKLAGAIIELAEAQAEADAQAEHARKQAARQRRAERQERQDQDTERPKDNRPSGKPRQSQSGLLYDRLEDAQDTQDGGQA